MPIIIPSVGGPAPGPLFAIGDLDLTQFVRFDQPADPYDQDGFQDPQFFDNPFSEGQALANIDVTNRVMSWPLYLNRDTKDLLHQFVIELNQGIAAGLKDPPLTVQWRDANATDITYYDASFARFDPEWRYWPGKQNWLAGRLTVYCTPPYGHTGTERLIATIGASLGHALAAVPVPTVLGDAPALLEMTVGANIHVASNPAISAGVGSGAIVGVTILPYGHQGEFSAGSLVAGAGATLIGDMRALSSQALRTFTNAPQVVSLPAFYLPASGAGATPYQGNQRVIALMRHSSFTAASGAASVAVSMTNRRGFQVGATAILSQAISVVSGFPTYYTPVDLGVWDVDADISPTQALRISVGVPSMTGVTGTQAVDLGGLILLPENDTSLLSDPFLAASAVPTAGQPTYTFDGVNSKLNGFRRTGFGQYIADMRDRQIGNTPKITPGASQQVAAFVMPIPGDYGSIGTGNFTADVKVRERFTFAR
jgi:hypothetical protein